MTGDKNKGMAGRVAQAIKGGNGDNGGKGPRVDGDAVRELAALLEETGLTEIEVEENGRRLRVAKQSGVALAPQSYAAAAPQAAPAAAATEAAPEPQRKKGTLVTSPMVGTVYLSPQPGSPAFVKIGDAVKNDQVLCIIEAMKTMNQVHATAAGRIGEIYVHDGQPVEFGEPLMLIE